MRAGRAWVVALAFCATMCAADDAVLIRNADVYPVTATVMKGVSLLIQDGKIVEIGAKVIAPKGAKIVEAKGMRVYPGMIDSGTTLGLSEIGAERVTVDTGELGEFMPQLKALIAVNPDSATFAVTRVNGITSAMTYPAGGRGGGGGGRGAAAPQFIAGRAAFIRLSGWTWEEMEILRSAAMQLNFPSIAGRGGRGGEGAEAPESGRGPAPFTEAKRQYDQQIKKIDEFFDAARQYQKERTANAPGFIKDLKMEAMLPVLEQKEPVAITANRERSIHDAILFAEKHHIRAVIVQPHELGKMAAELKSRNIPVILGRTEALSENEDDPYDKEMTLPAEAYKAGVKFAFGTFSNEWSRNLPFNAARAVAFGLPYEEGLKAITINAAEIWGVSSETGSIEKGKSADLIVTDGDPMELPTQIKRLYIKGKEVELTSRQVELYRRYMERQ
jgi:imidazolonepropionase-like amidohydrolase